MATMMLRKKEPEMPKHIARFIAQIQELVALMEQENTLVTERRFADYEVVRVKKQKLAMDYRASFKAVTSDAEALKGLSADVRKALKDAGAVLAEASERNARTLRGVMLAVQKMLQNVVSSIRATAAPKINYGNPAQAHMQLGTYSPVCESMAVRRTV